MRSTPLAICITIGFLGNLIVEAKLPPAENSSRLKQVHPGTDSVLTTSDVYFGLYYKGKGDAANLKLRPTDAQLEEAFKKDPVLNLLLTKFVKKYGLHATYAFDQVDAEEDFNLPPAPAATAARPSVTPSVPESKPHIFVRRSITKLPPGVGKDTTADDMKKSAQKLADNGAFFSYGRQFDLGVDQWTAEGVVALEQNFYWVPFGEPSFATISRLISFVEFSRIDIGGDVADIKKKLQRPKISKLFANSESNALNLGLGLEQNIQWPTFGPFDGSIASIRFVERTDFDFQSQIPTGEFEWMPTAGLLGMGSFNTLSNALWWKTDLALHIDFGHVASDGRWTVSSQGSTFAHIGPKASVSIMPFPTWSFFQKKPLVITGNFAQYERLTGQSKEVRIAGADASFYLRPPPMHPNETFDPAVALTVSYKNFRNAENELDDNVIILGLGIGF
jgi:hypothetical protein